MLDQQRDSIRELMQSAGYVADVAPVQHGSLDGFQSGSGQSQPQLSGQQQPSSAVARHVRRHEQFVGTIGRRREAGPTGAPVQPGDAS